LDRCKIDCWPLANDNKDVRAIRLCLGVVAIANKSESNEDL
jgi:hypothetical protein